MVHAAAPSKALPLTLTTIILITHMGPADLLTRHGVIRYGPGGFSVHAARNTKYQRNGPRDVRLNPTLLISLILIPTVL